MELKPSVAASVLLFLSCTAQAGVLRVCSEPNNLPFSNRAGEGFEDKIAKLIAHDWGDRVEYVYALQNKRFVKHTFGTGQCDVMMGVAVGTDELDTTSPYYASSYVFVSRRADALDIHALTDTRLQKLKIGVHLIGDDSSPAEVALGQEGIVNNVHGYLLYGDFARPNPPARLIEAVEQGDVDIAAVWGPLAGYFAKSSAVPLRVVTITDTEKFKPLAFRFAIALGVRKSDSALRDRLNTVLAREKSRIDDILRSYGVPLIDLQEVAYEHE